MKSFTCRFFFTLLLGFLTNISASSIEQQIADIETSISKAQIDFTEQKEKKEVNKLLSISKTLYENNKKLKQLLSYEPLKVQDIIVSTSLEATKSDEKLYPNTAFYVFARFENNTDEKVEAHISVKDNHSEKVIFTANPTREPSDEHKYVGMKFSPDMFEAESSFSINFSLKTASIEPIVLKSSADISYFEMKPHFPNELKKGVSKRFSITPPVQFVAPFKLEYESGNGIVLSLNEDSLSGFVGTTSKSKEDFRDGIILTLSDAKGNKAYDRIYIHVPEPPKKVYTPSTYIPPVITKVEPKKVVPTPKVESTPKYEPAPLSYYEAQQREAKNKKSTSSFSTNYSTNQTPKVDKSKCNKLTNTLGDIKQKHERALYAFSGYKQAIDKAFNDKVAFMKRTYKNTNLQSLYEHKRNIDYAFNRYTKASQCEELRNSFSPSMFMNPPNPPSGYYSWADVCTDIKKLEKSFNETFAEIKQQGCN